MQKSFLTLFCALCALSFIPSSVMATDYTVEPTTAIKSNTVPIFINSASVYGSITQQIFLPSEMKDADENTPSAGDITKITFYYAVKDGQSAAAALSRDIEIWLMEIDDDIDAYQYDNTSAYGSLYKSKFFCNASKKAGVKVYDGKLETKAITIGEGKQSLPFEITPFTWDGESNIVLTLYDKSASSSQIGTDAYNNLRFYITETTGGRFVHYRWTGSATDDRNTWMSDLDKYGDTYSTPTNTADAQSNTHRYVSLTTFTITPSAAPVAPSTPENLAASSIGSTSASLSWSAVSGATSYDLQQSANGSDWSTLASSISGTSYSWTGLSASTTYHVRVRAVNAVGNSDWSGGISFTTDVASDAITYKDITFNKYEETNNLPTSGGNYYLANNITLSSNKTITGDLKLCLNGHTIYTVTNRIIVDGGATLTLYNNESEGLIYGGVETSIAEGGVIDVEDGGTLIIPEGRIENIADAGYGSYAVLSSGTLKISGSPELIGESASIYLYGSGKVITIEEGKPLTNTKPYKVNSTGQTITSGWANMDGANPCRYFTSAKTSYSAVVLNSGEVKLVTSDVKLIDSSDNGKKITDNQGVVSVLAMTRSITSAQYNTICLPFALGSDKMAEIFGAGYDLEEFVSSSLEDDVLSLTFAPRYSLEAGKPYLLKPDWDIINPTFENVTISVEDPVDNTSDAHISFHGTFSPTELTGGNHDLLFLGAGNELFYPASTANIKAFRAYFELKGAAVNSAPKARIVKKQDSATGIENQMVNGKCGNHKFLKDGQLYILREGKMYNVLGMEK